ncbi:MAG TPA: cyclase family protein [Acidimicrobiia bacterium]|nr:cyclase family protein [Acidimicrobiia bacterium]
MPLPPELKELAQRLSNWGRWGDDDQRGTLNFITSEAVLRGVSTVRRGETFSLAIPFDEDGPQIGAIPGRINPRRTMTAVNAAFTGDPSDFTTSDDAFEMGAQAATHWDALAHVGYDGLLYNDTPDTVVTDAGAARLGIDQYGPIVTRGVLLDIARLLGVEYFEDAHAITGEDLATAERQAGASVERGDILLVRTGQMEWLRRGDKRRFSDPSPGIGVDAIEYLHDKRVAAVATDTLVFEVWPCEDPTALLPVHMIDLRDLGLVQGQLWHLDDLAADCAADGVHEFLLAATPLPLTHGLGGPVAPTATK